MTTPHDDLEAQWDFINPQRESNDSDFNSFYDHKIGMFSAAEMPGHCDYDQDGEECQPPPTQTAATTLGLKGDEIPF